MTIQEKSFNYPYRPVDYDQQLRDLFVGMHEITQRHAQHIPGGIFSLDDAAQQELISAINPYISFEFSQYPGLRGLPVQITGKGIAYFSDLDGEIAGKQLIEDTDMLTGTIADVCVFPVPTKEWLMHADESDTLLSDEALSPVLILANSTMMLDRDDTGVYQTEADLSHYQACLPLIHYLRVQPTHV